MPLSEGRKIEVGNWISMESQRETAENLTGNPLEWLSDLVQSVLTDPTVTASAAQKTVIRDLFRSRIEQGFKVHKQGLNNARIAALQTENSEINTEIP